MNTLISYINEDKFKYPISADFRQKSDKIVDEFIEMLPKYEDAKLDNRNMYNKWRDTSSRTSSTEDSAETVENAKFIGKVRRITITLDTKVNNDINVDVIKSSFEDIFKSKILESVFDNNLDSKDPLYERKWVNELYKDLSKYFKSNNFSHMRNIRQGYNWTPSVFKNTISKCPTIEKDGLFVSLYGVDFSWLKEDYAFSKITMMLFIYEKKDPAKIAEIKAANDTRVPVDCIGRELKVGDTIVYAKTGYQNSYKGLEQAKIEKVSKEMVDTTAGRMIGYKCCLISRADGKKIE